MVGEVEGIVDGMMTGVATARSAVGRSPERASDAQVEAALTAAERLRRAADALQLTVIAEVDRRGEEQGPDGIFRPRRLDEGRVADMAPDVVAVATRTSMGEAGRRCDLAARLAGDLPELTQLLAEGRVSERILELVEKQTRDLQPETTAAVLEHLLAPIRGRPGSMRIADLEQREISRACRRIIERVEPEALAERARHNRSERLDVRTDPGPVGTTCLTAMLPSEIGAAIKSAVDAAAEERMGEQPGLTKGAARALGLADLCLRGVEVTAHVRLGIPVITSAASRLGFAPGDGGEHLPFGNEVVCTHGGMGEVDCSCFGPHGPGDSAPDGGGGGSGRVVTGEGADTVDVLTEEWAGSGLQTQTATTFGPDGPIGWVSGTTIPGVGYVPPDVVAAITAQLNTRVSRALLDARTGTLVETRNPRYVVPDSMRDFVTAREGTCRMWGCDRPVHTSRTGWGADLDHATPWPDGETTPANLSALCRHHHRVKHAPRWGHDLRPDGTATWTTPGGAPAFTFPDHVVQEQDAPGASGEPWSPPGVGNEEPPARELVGVGPPPF